MGLPSLTKTGTATLRGEFCEVYHEKINQIFVKIVEKMQGDVVVLLFFKISAPKHTWLFGELSDIAFSLAWRLYLYRWF